MKKRNFCFLSLVFLTLLVAGCNDSKTKPGMKEEKVTEEVKTDKDVPVHNSSNLEAPNFTNTELKQYYSTYTAYINKVVTAIQNKDEVTTMKIFNEEGKQFNNLNEMEKKARSEDEQEFAAWLMHAMPYQKIIIESEYYKKFNEAYYKKVKEKFEKKN